MRTTSILSTVLAVGVLVLTGCGSDEGDDAGAAGGASPVTSSPESSSSAPAEDAVLATADSDLGEIVVDGEGMTVYVFDRDTPGSGQSACSGGCLEAWPPVVAESESPTVEGVSGEVGTITRDDGTLQVTLEGYPLYLWQNDTAPGDTTGQGVQGVWWVVAPDGTKITATAAPDALPGY
jgi:predicted lipoprotein with Yx(FWY)xxD motif